MMVKTERPMEIRRALGISVRTQAGERSAFWHEGQDRCVLASQND